MTWCTGYMAGVAVQGVYRIYGWGGSTRSVQDIWLGWQYKECTETLTPVGRRNK